MGQRSRATIDPKWKKNYLQDRKFVPLIVPGVSTNSGSVSSSTALAQESLGPEAPLVSGHWAASSSSSGSVARSDELATKRLGRESQRSDKKDTNDPLAYLPFWFKDGTDNLEPTEVHAPAHIFQESDSEHPAKVATKSRKHSIFSHFPKDRDCDVCLRTKITKASGRRRTGDALPRAEKFGDLITADHKVPNGGM